MVFATMPPLSFPSYQSPLSSSFSYFLYFQLFKNLSHFLHLTESSGGLDPASVCLFTKLLMGIYPRFSS